MEKIETRDHPTNVDSFSQSLLIPPSPVKDRSAVRLFGTEFKITSTTSTANRASTDTVAPSILSTGDSNKDSGNSRKFACHYCCRNFPTSQALGGHQNAHRRERQRAKHSASPFPGRPRHLLVTTDHHHLYGGTTHLPPHLGPKLTGYYHHHYSPPSIKGHQLGWWKIPAVEARAGTNRGRPLPPAQYPLISSMSSPLLEGEPASVIGDNKGLQEPLSLDLRL